MKKPTKEMKEMHALAMQCHDAQVKKGRNEDVVTKEICEFIENSTYKDPKMIMAAMRMHFLGQSVAQASAPIIKSILG